jgi:formylmethanofuran dehydrogenase subunit E
MYCHQIYSGTKVEAKLEAKKYKKTKIILCKSCGEYHIKIIEE